jgi:hypothetical protein
MALAELRARLAAVPDVAVAESPAVQQHVADAVAYLASADAAEALRRDPYWPKWRSPWWDMLTLYELGCAERIPKCIAVAMVAALDAMPLHEFPIREDEWPPGVDRRRHTSCHCALGTMDQVLRACGVDVDRELPWIAGWYARYQMADGGYNCDESAYLAAGAPPSSMVATVPILEALAQRAPSELADRAAAMLIARELRLGSPTAHNAEERAAAQHWGELCFPRLYFYDVLRGIAALTRWATAHGRTLPLAAIAPVLEHLLAHAGDGIARVGRTAWAGMTTIVPDDNWAGRYPAVSPRIALAPGDPSPELTRQWTAVRRDVIALIDAGRVAAG